MTPTPQPTRYEEICGRECEWCGKGNQRIYECLGGPRHVSDAGKSWDISTYVPCTAPTLAEFSERQEKQIDGLRDLLDRIRRIACGEDQPADNEDATNDDTQALATIYKLIDAALKEETNAEIL